MPASTVRNWDAVRFGAIIKRLRMLRGWTLVELSRRSLMNPAYLGVLEKGRNTTSLSTLLTLAEVFQIPAAEIVTELESARTDERRVQDRQTLSTSNATNTYRLQFGRVRPDVARRTHSGIADARIDKR